MLLWNWLNRVWQDDELLSLTAALWPHATLISVLTRSPPTMIGGVKSCKSTNIRTLWVEQDPPGSHNSRWKVCFNYISLTTLMEKEKRKGSFYSIVWCIDSSKGLSDNWNHRLWPEQWKCQSFSSVDFGEPLFWVDLDVHYVSSAWTWSHCSPFNDMDILSRKIRMSTF